MVRDTLHRYFGHRRAGAKALQFTSPDAGLGLSRFHHLDPGLLFGNVQSVSAQLRPALVLMLAMTVITGVIYPHEITGMAQLIF